MFINSPLEFLSAIALAISSPEGGAVIYFIASSRSSAGRLSMMLSMLG
jgi:hypothetical protein